MTVYLICFHYKLDSGLDTELYDKILDDKFYSMIIYNFLFVIFFIQHNNLLLYILKQAFKWLVYNGFRMLE
jgi:hypothetical protein